MTGQINPRINPRRTAFDWALEAVCLIALLGIFAVLAMYWRELPAQVLRHFDAAGNANGWGAKNGLLVLPLTATALYLILTVASRYQRLFNIPMEIDRDAPGVQSILLRMTITMKAIVLFTFLYIAWGNVRTAVGRGEGLGREFLPVSMAAVFLALGFYVIQLRRYRE